MKVKLNNYQKMKMSVRKNDKAKGKIHKEQVSKFTEKQIDEFRKKNGLPRLQKNKPKKKDKKNKYIKNDITIMFQENDDYGDANDNCLSFDAVNIKRKKNNQNKDCPKDNKLKNNKNVPIEGLTTKEIYKNNKEFRRNLLQSNDSIITSVNGSGKVSKTKAKENHSSEVDVSCKMDKLQLRMLQRYNETKSGQINKESQEKIEIHKDNKVNTLKKKLAQAKKNLLGQEKKQKLQGVKKAKVALQAKKFTLQGDKKDKVVSHEKTSSLQSDTKPYKVALNENKLTLQRVKKNSKKEKLKKLLEKCAKEKINSGSNLRDRMLEKLKAAQFRFINEKLYTSTGQEAQQLFAADPAAFSAYHQGYQQQTSKWPLNPLDVVVNRIKNMPKTHIIADMGCGEAALSRRVPQTVHSLDLVACAPHVTACDMARTPLNAQSVDVSVYCLSLMGTDITAYLCEANRVLKIGGRLLIAEVESRFDDINAFTLSVERIGFKLKRLDKQHQVFFFLEFDKTRDAPAKSNKLPEIKLKPCLYKRR